MKIARWLLGVLAASLLAVAACAPVDGPAPSAEEEKGTGRDSDRQADGKSPAEEKPLAVVPAGVQQRVAAAIRNIQKRDLSTANSFWTVFHGILGLGPGIELVDPRTKERVKALDYICNGGELKGLNFRANPLLGVEVISTMDTLGQGHQDQFIAEMAQWGMPADRKIVVQGKPYTFLDFVRYSQARATLLRKQELSWTIIIVSQYLDVTKPWTNMYNEKVTFEDLVRYELNESIENAACGGTHRLFGLSWVYHQHLLRGGKTEGVWKAVAEKTVQYRDRARQMQNGDGTFSTAFFRERGHADDKNLRINTTGHIFEWLALALSDHELRQQWVQDAANALALLILEMQGDPIDSGGMYHAVHGLLIYYARVFDRSFCPPELLVPLPPSWKKV